ncbi:MAG: hypothetical protein CMJ18_24910 [Phycisphaeraceae bacterium]|nr:hypothetical protein [Phycisphaeraceae bacterium]
MMNPGRPLLAAFCLALAGLPSCAAYRLQGTVLPDQTADITTVDENDTRLYSGGLAGAAIELTVDPASMHPRPLSPAVTDANGQFSVPIDELGAGLLEYELAILCRHKGFRPLYQVVQVPGRRQRLLIRMTPGPDHGGGPSPDVLKETLEWKKQLMGPEPGGQ